MSEKVRLRPHIVAFKLAEDRREAERILRQWGPAGRRKARRGTYGDFAFIVVYVAALIGGCLWLRRLADRHDLGWLAAVALVGVALAIVAGLSDVVEDA